MRFALAMVLMLCGCSNGPVRVVEERTSLAPAERGDALLRLAMLTGQNAARAAVGVAPLAWDARLAASARAYADEMARTGRFEHAKQSLGMDREGENLWTGTRGAYRYDEMVRHWIDERRFYRAAPAPDFSNSGKWEDVAHYTQIVWRGTTTMGCAMASNARDDYLVCRYSPPGNVVGRVAY